MGNDSSTERKGKESGIVVVSNTKQEKKEAPHSQLEYCPTFEPLLSTSVSIPETRPLLSELVKPINSEACLKLCTNLQNHLEQCSEAVKFDQLSLAARIKKVDSVSAVVMQRLTERQRAFAKHAEHTRKLEDISSSLNRIQVNLDDTLKLADELNMLLPVEQRLETFELY